MSWPSSVRARLAFWHGLALLLVVAVYAAAVLVQVQDDLYEALDGQLEGDFALAVEWLQNGVPAECPACAGGCGRRFDPRQRWRRGRAVGRRLVARRPAGVRRRETAGVAVALRAASEVGRVRPYSLSRGGGDARPAAGSRGSFGGQPVYVRVGRSERFARQELGEFAAVLGLSLPFAFAVAAAAGYLLARRALAPVSAMTARARRITAEHLDERLPVENPADEFGALAGVVNDALDRLERAFQTLRRFTADASHELRTPLTAIRSVGEVGLRERRGEADYREMIGSILEEVERLTAMVDNLLLLSRADAGKADLRPAPMSLDDLAKAVAADLAVLAEEKRQEVQVEAVGAVTVVADRPTVRQAAVNLLDNAIKYSPNGAVIRLVVETRRTGRRAGGDR